MRRFLIVMALFLMMTDTVDSLLAEPAGGMQTEVIDEEETPQESGYCGDSRLGCRRFCCVCRTGGQK